MYDTYKTNANFIKKSVVEEKSKCDQAGIQKKTKSSYFFNKSID